MHCLIFRLEAGKLQVFWEINKAREFYPALKVSCGVEVIMFQGQLMKIF
jgi:hypothetical protein